MTIEILQDDHPTLLEVSEPVLPGDDITELVENLKAALATTNGLGLAAVQIGVLKRVFIFIDRKGETHVCVNPEILRTDKLIKSRGEGCLSLQQGNDRYTVVRYKRLWVKYHDENGELMTCRLANQEAVAYQHELDHLDGILINSKGKK